jgi:hypothetical protein
MLTILWNPHGFHVVIMLPLRASFKAAWFIDGNLVPLVAKFFPAGLNAGGRKLLVDNDKAPAHNSKMTQNFFGHSPLKRPPHPAYPSAFCLFGKVTSAPIGGEIPDEIDLLEAVTKISNGSSDVELQFLFQSWIKRVERVIDARADYLTGPI